MYFTFDHPGYLVYLLSIPLLIITHYAFLKYTRRRALRFANFQALKRVTDEKVVTKNHLILILRCAIIFCLVLAISGTSLWYKGQSSNNDFIIALDTSSSMTAQDFRPNRIEAAKDYISTFVDNVNPQGKIGILTFSGASFIEHLPTTNKGEIKRVVSEIEPAAVGGTDIAGAIITGCNMLIGSENGKILILITDGSNTVNFFTKDPIDEAIKYAKSNSVSIYTIGLGTDSGPIGYLPEYYNISAVFDDVSLIKLANETSGKYYYAADQAELEATYNDILSETREAFIPIRIGSILAVVALIIIFIEWGLVNTRYRSIP
ncbi:MAG TPA: VWA domain-containing protein [Alphaproteobacteria bacterium]|nr:VWA domain-containing protein [Alphaproteobacteria bacterium]